MQCYEFISHLYARLPEFFLLFEDLKSFRVVLWSAGNHIGRVTRIQRSRTAITRHGPLTGVTIALGVGFGV